MKRQLINIGLFFTPLLLSFFVFSLSADFFNISGVSTNYFILNPRNDYYQTNKYVYGGAYPQTFPKKKSPHSFRIFVFGGSSIAFMKDFHLLKEMLSREYPSMRFEIVNVGVVCYGTNRLLPIIKEVLNYNPDLLIYYEGHNEFLEQFLEKQLWPNSLKELIKRLLHFKEFVFLFKIADRYLQKANLVKLVYGGSISWGRPLSALEREKIYLNYESNINKIVCLAKEAGAGVMLSTVAYNYVDDRYISPSYHSAQHKSTELDLKQRSIKDLSDGEILSFSEKETNDPYIQNRLGNYYLGKRDFSKAREHFINAAQYDFQPFRANATTNGIIRKISKEQNILLVEVEETIVRHSPHLIPDFTLFTDWCHLNDEGKRLLQKEFFDKIRSAINSSATRSSPNPVFSTADA